MIRGVLCLLLAGVVVLASLALAADDPKGPEEPPIRLKKKNQKVDPAKPEPKAEENPQPEKPPMPPGEDKKPEVQPKEGDKVNPAEEEEQEVLDRVARTMKAVQNRLANKELNDGTRQMQDDILKDLDSLIKMNEDPPEGSGGGADNNNQDQQNQDQQNQGQKGQQGQKKQQSRLGGQRGQQQMAQGKQQGRRGQSGRQQANRQPNGQQSGNQQANNPPQQPKPSNSNPQNAGIHDPSGMPRRDTDVFKDAWGHLPEALRAQMNAYSSREQYMEKHQDLIAQYYKSIAAKGQKKGN